MPKNEYFFRDMEEDSALATAQAICGALGLQMASDLDAIIMEAEIERQWRQAEARNFSRGIKALKALRVTA
jgi:hypothetical protein